MSEIEHLIGIRRAAGYDEDDVRELVARLNCHPAVAFAVELAEPAASEPSRDGLRRWTPSKTLTMTCCRWCGQGFWHDEECRPGRHGGRVHARHCMRLEYRLVSADAQVHLMHAQLREQWERETAPRPSSSGRRSSTEPLTEGPLNQDA